MYGSFKYYTPVLPAIDEASVNSSGNYVSSIYLFSDMAAEGSFFCWGPVDAPGVSFDSGTGLITYVTPDVASDQKDLVVGWHSTEQPSQKPSTILPQSVSL